MMKNLGPKEIICDAAVTFTVWVGMIFTPLKSGYWIFISNNLNRPTYWPSLGKKLKFHS